MKLSQPIHEYQLCVPLNQVTTSYMVIACTKLQNFNIIYFMFQCVRLPCEYVLNEQLATRRLYHLIYHYIAIVTCVLIPICSCEQEYNSVARILKLCIVVRPQRILAVEQPHTGYHSCVLRISLIDEVMHLVSFSFAEPDIYLVQYHM